MTQTERRLLEENAELRQTLRRHEAAISELIAAAHIAAEQSPDGADGSTPNYRAATEDVARRATRDLRIERAGRRYRDFYDKHGRGRPLTTGEDEDAIRHAARMREQAAQGEEHEHRTAARRGGD